MDRLAAVVCSIQQDAAAVPKGAYMQTNDGAVVRNKSFYGLSLAEASCCSYYLHFSTPPSSTVSSVRLTLYPYVTLIGCHYAGCPRAISLSGHH